MTTPRRLNPIQELDARGIDLDLAPSATITLTMNEAGRIRLGIECPAARAEGEEEVINEPRPKRRYQTPHNPVRLAEPPRDL